MKKLWMILVALIVTVAASGCGSRNVAPPMTISGTIKPVALIAQAIAGTSLQVQVLAGDDGSPLQNAQELVSRSAVVFRTGTPVDTWSTAMEEGGVSVVSLSGASDKGVSDGSWLSFRDSADMARLIRDTLAATYPDLKEQFDSAYARFMDQCSQADGRLKRLVWSAGTRGFLAEDMTWSSAARDFGLRVVVQPALKGLDLSGAEAASRVADWGFRTEDPGRGSGCCSWRHYRTQPTGKRHRRLHSGCSWRNSQRRLRALARGTADLARVGDREVGARRPGCGSLSSLRGCGSTGLDCDGLPVFHRFLP